MEVFLTEDDPGFDLIIGNPPYVRQEDILPPEDPEYLEYLLKEENADEKKEVNRAYKKELSDKVYSTYPFLDTTIRTDVDGTRRTIPIYGRKVPGRSDLYVYFQLLCPQYLNSNGTFCFIISNSWLDVGYGSFVQHFLLKHAKLFAIYDSNVRSFSAKVNTVIYLHSALLNTDLSDRNFKNLEAIDNKVRFILNKTNYSDAAYSPILIEQENLSTNKFRDFYRVVIESQKNLFDAAYDLSSKKYEGDKWGGKYLYAPEIYWKIFDSAEEKKLNKKIGQFFEGERYLNTGGADGFFVITNFENNEQSFRVIINNEETIEVPHELVEPLIKDYVKQNRQIKVDGFDAYCFVADPISLSNSASEYIKWGEEEGYHKKSVTKYQDPWYKPTRQMLHGAELLVPRSFNDTFVIYYNPKKFLSLRFYRLHIKKGNLQNFVGLFNSTLMYLYLETLGNKSLGEGALDFFMESFLRMKFPIVQNKSLIQSTEKLYSRDIENVFDELGFKSEKNIRSQFPQPKKDRKVIDDIIFDELGLTKEERKEVYWSVAELVKQRLDKAASR